MNMNVGARRTYEAKKKKMKEFAVIFAGIFTTMVRDHMVGQDSRLKVLDLTTEYSSQVQNLTTI